MHLSCVRLGARCAQIAAAAAAEREEAEARGCDEGDWREGKKSKWLKRNVLGLLMSRETHGGRERGSRSGPRGTRSSCVAPLTSRPTCSSPPAAPSVCTAVASSSWAHARQTERPHYR